MDEWTSWQVNELLVDELLAGSARSDLSEYSEYSEYSDYSDYSDYSEYSDYSDYSSPFDKKVVKEKIIPK